MARQDGLFIASPMPFGNESTWDQDTEAFISDLNERHQCLSALILLLKPDRNKDLRICLLGLVGQVFRIDPQSHTLGHAMTLQVAAMIIGFGAKNPKFRLGELAALFGGAAS